MITFWSDENTLCLDYGVVDTQVYTFVKTH